MFLFEVQKFSRFTDIIRQVQRHFNDDKKCNPSFMGTLFN